MEGAPLGLEGVAPLREDALLDGAAAAVGVEEEQPDGNVADVRRVVLDAEPAAGAEDLGVSVEAGDRVDAGLVLAQEGAVVDRGGEIVAALPSCGVLHSARAAE